MAGVARQERRRGGRTQERSEEMAIDSDGSAAVDLGGGVSGSRDGAATAPSGTHDARDRASARALFGCGSQPR